MNLEFFNNNVKVSKGKGKRKKTYYLYDSYDNFEKAINVAKEKKNKNKYVIKEVTEGFLFPTKKFGLYLNNTLTVRSF